MKLDRKKMLLISFMLFSLFFGAGNLIFPPFLGQNAGSSTVSALPTSRYPTAQPKAESSAAVRGFSLCMVGLLLLWFVPGYSTISAAGCARFGRSVVANLCKLLTYRPKWWYNNFQPF